MNFINRAFKNVSRKLSKTILLTIAFFLIGNLVIVGLGVASATDNAKTLTRKKMRAVVTYEIDYDAIYKYTETITDEDELNEFYNKNYPRIKMENIQELMNDSRIKTANAISGQMIYKTEEFDYVHLNNEAESNMMDGKQCYLDANGNEVCDTYIEPSFFVKANMFANMIEIEDEEYTITEGRFYTQEEIDDAKQVALITNELAKANGLTVGDTFSFYFTNPNDYVVQQIDIDEEDIKAEYEIIGLYDPKYQITPDSDQYNWSYPYDNPNNTILMPMTSFFMSQLTYQQKSYDYYMEQYPEYYEEDQRPTEESILNQYINDVTFLLNDPLEVDNFVEEYSNNLPQFMKLNANNEEFKRLSKPLDTLNLYANFIIWLVVINAVVIITLVTALTLKTREYEIGVLLSIGASKLKVIGQFFVELALVAILGFTLSVASGSLIANKVGQKVLEYQIQESEVSEEDDPYYYEEYYSVWDTNYTTEISLDDLLEEYSVRISPLIIAEIYVLGLGIVLVSIVIPSMMIMRFNPKKILMNQN